LISRPLPLVTQARRDHGEFLYFRPDFLRGKIRTNPQPLSWQWNFTLYVLLHYSE